MREEILGLVHHILRLEAHIGQVDDPQKRVASEDIAMCRIKLRKLKHRLREIVTKQKGGSKLYAKYSILFAFSEDGHVTPEACNVNRLMNQMLIAFRIISYDCDGNYFYQVHPLLEVKAVTDVEDVFRNARPMSLHEFHRTSLDLATAKRSRCGTLNQTLFHKEGVHYDE